MLIGSPPLTLQNWGLHYWASLFDNPNRFLFKQVLIRLIGADEHIYTSYADSMQWLEDMNVLEIIVDKFSSSVSCSKHV